MDNEKFTKICKKLVRDYFNLNVDKSDNFKIKTSDVFIVWSCKTLQNNKVLASTTVPDNKYYEITYNGDKKEIYFDAYIKLQNICFSLDELVLDEEEE